MEWFKEEVPPEKEGEYLGCGQAIEWSMSETSNPDFYFISYWNGKDWTPQENYGREFFMQYWTYLPPKPKIDESEKMRDREKKQSSQKVVDRK